MTREIAVSAVPSARCGPATSPGGFNNPAARCRTRAAAEPRAHQLQHWRGMKIRLLLAAVCCAALSGAYAQSPSPAGTADTGASPSATTSKETKTRRSKKRTQKTGTEDVTGSTGPSTGGAPQTNSTYGSRTTGTGTQATVGDTSNTNPNASTGNMNPQGSATGQATTPHRRTKAKKHKTENETSPTASPSASASP